MGLMVAGVPAAGRGQSHRYSGIFLKAIDTDLCPRLLWFQTRYFLRAHALTIKTSVIAAIWDLCVTVLRSR